MLPCNTRLPNVSFVSNANPTSQNPVSRMTRSDEESGPHASGRQDFADVAEKAGNLAQESARLARESA
jgi:hypothetical protein